MAPRLAARQPEPATVGRIVATTSPNSSIGGIEVIGGRQRPETAAVDSAGCQVLRRHDV
jgi:hypothetical protein